MNTPLGRNGFIGIAVAATAGLGLIALIIYRKRCHRVELEVRTCHRLMEQADGAALLQQTLDDQEAEAQQQAVAAVEAAVQGLSPEQQLELRNQLDQVLSCVASLRSEVAELRGGLQDIALQIIQDVKRGVEDSQRVRRRRHVIHRERTDSNSSSSIYFTASQGLTSTLRQEDSQEEEEEEDGELEEDVVDEGRLQLRTEVPSVELALLLAQSDILHTGDATLKAEGCRLLLDNRTEYGDSREFLWRLARAYTDVYKSTKDKQQKKTYAQQGREEAELALMKNGLNAECHKWFAVVTALNYHHESIHGKLKTCHILKEHVDRAIALRDDDPVCFFLLGKWCYEVASLDWLETKTAAALYQSPPSSSLHDALENFLKAEELSPGFSKMVRLYIAKCHKELGNLSEAINWRELTVTMNNVDDDEETSQLETELHMLAVK